MALHTSTFTSLGKCKGGLIPPSHDWSLKGLTQEKLTWSRGTDCPDPSHHSFIPPCLPSDVCACHLAPFSLLRVYINTNPPKKGKIFSFFLLWIKFQQTWLRIRHASQIKVCWGEREGGRIRGQTQPSLPFLKMQVRIIKSPYCWTEVLSKGYSLFG